jgi:hypothetical protein
MFCLAISFCENQDHRVPGMHRRIASHLHLACITPVGTDISIAQDLVESSQALKNRKKTTTFELFSYEDAG